MKKYLGKKYDLFSYKQKEALVSFLDACPPLRLSPELRRILLDYITREKDMLPLDFDVYLSDFQTLFEFLDVLIDEK